MTKQETNTNQEVAPAISSKTITPKELATELNVDAKTLRRVMRSMAQDTPGSGARWEISEEFADKLRERMNRTHNRKVVAFVPKADS